MDGQTGQTDGQTGSWIDCKKDLMTLAQPFRETDNRETLCEANGHIFQEKKYNKPQQNEKKRILKLFYFDI